ncbi:MAG: class I SAM-dependent methyltransferase [Myxococcota bacterium]
MADDDILREGSESHYRDAAYYDQAYRRRQRDREWYVAFAQERLAPGARILELGCGTGRIGLALAEAGFSVLGVDAMAPMLARAEARRAKRPRRVRERLAFVRGDLRRVRLGERFDLVISPFNVFMHLYERRDVEQALATVAAHARRGARFAFDVLLPDPVSLGRDPERVYRVGHVSRSGVRYRYRERFCWDPMAQVQHVDLAFLGVEDPTDFELQTLTHRHFFPRELEALLHYNGFAIERHEGDWDGEALAPFHESQVIVARRRSGPA